ncbi:MULTISPECIES: hypothetical protein [Mesorhizobium]|nr:MULTISPECIES: hypothetical protein [Mesorhizobium]MCF6123241.1 hypothetical protein [Mesorhizobium ciceri]MCQ8817104.1 hypothetical protein [Mesorhizobium sp. SEMIA396]
MSHGAQRAGRFEEFHRSAVCVKGAFAIKMVRVRQKTARGAASHAH